MILDSGERHENSLLYTAFKYIKNKVIIRTSFLLIGIALIITSNVLVYEYSNKGSQWTLTAMVFFGCLRPLLSTFGINLILLPMLVGRFRLLNYFFKMRFLLVFSQLFLGTYLWYPLVFLSFLYQQHQMIPGYLYLTIFYYFIGCFSISLFFAYITYMLIQAPIISLTTIFRE